MPNSQAPKMEPPMQAAQTPKDEKSVVTEQPKAEPQPSTDNEEVMGLRGGYLNLGCSCCHGTLSFYKSCC